MEHSSPIPMKIDKVILKKIPWKGQENAETGSMDFYPKVSQHLSKANKKSQNPPIFPPQTPKTANWQKAPQPQEPKITDNE